MKLKSYLIMLAGLVVLDYIIFPPGNTNNAALTGDFIGRILRDNIFVGLPVYLIVLGAKKIRSKNGSPPV